MPKANHSLYSMHNKHYIPLKSNLLQCNHILYPILII